MSLGKSNIGKLRGPASTPPEDTGRADTFKMASQSLEEAIKGWAVVSQQCEEVKVDHRKVKIEIENLLKELQEKIRELS